MKLLFTSADLGNVFNALIRAARWYVPPQLHADGSNGSGIPQLLDAAIRFTIQLLIDAAKSDQHRARDLESSLTAKLSTWTDENGAMTLRLWTHDMSCVVGALTLAAFKHAHPRPPSSEGVVKYIMETLPRNLAVAAVAFTIQLVLEETELPAVAMRGLESELIRKLEAPWEFGKIPLSVDVASGKTWEELHEKE